MRSSRLLLGVSVMSAAAAVVSAETTSYKYDSRGRLVEVGHAGGPNNGIATVYALDKADNRVSKATGPNGSAPPPPPPPSPTPPPPSPPPSFSVSDASATEGGTLSFSVAKTGETDGTYTVNYATSAGTATAPGDYGNVSGTLTFGPSQTVLPVYAQTGEDFAYEGNETFVLTLSGASGGAGIGDAQATGTIVDNESPPPPPPSNHPPTTVPDNATVPMCSWTWKDVVANDSDPEGNTPITLVSVSGGGNGSPSVLDATRVAYQAGQYPETATVTYTVQDSLGNRSTGTLTITVSGGYCAPEN